MSTHIDALAALIEQSVIDSSATRADWLRALDQVFPIAELDPLEPGQGTEEYHLAWEIDSDGTSPVDAAIDTWRQIFRRGYLQPSADDACVFEVTLGDRSTQIDLSDERFAHLFR